MANTISLSGGGELTVVDASSFAGNWVVEGAILSVTNIDSSAKTLGTGKILLGTGGQLKSGYLSDSQYGNKYISNDIEVVGKGEIYAADMYYCRLALTGNITGLAGTSITKKGGWPIHIMGNNSGFAGDWYLEGDQLVLHSDNSLGTGTVYFKGAQFLATNADINSTDSEKYANAYARNVVIKNDLVLRANLNQYLVGVDGSAASVAGSKAIIEGNISSDYDIRQITIRGMNSRSTVLETVLRGDNTGFLGNWVIDKYILPETSDVNIASNKIAPIVSTDNTSNVKVETVYNGTKKYYSDSRFGAGTITLGFGKLRGDATSTYIHNDIKLKDNIPENPFVFEGSVLTLTGNLTDDENNTKKVVIALRNGEVTQDNPVSRLRLLDGDNSGFSGDWRLKNTFLVTNAGNVKWKAFGSGTIYLEGGAGLVGYSSTATASTYNSSRGRAYIYNDIIVSGTNYLRSDGDTVTVSNTNSSTSYNANFEVQLAGNISGDGLLIRTGGGYKWEIRGNNAAYTGDWLVQSDYLDTNNTATTEGNSPGVDVRFGSGTLYLDGGGVQGGGAIFSDITINKGKTGYLRNNDFQLGGQVSVNGTLDTTQKLTFTNALQGTGIMNTTATMAAGSILAPGSIGVTDAYGTAETDTQIGTLTFQRGLTLNPGSEVQIDFASTAVGGHDRILLDTATGYSSDVSLDGVTLSINFLDGFNFNTLTYGDTFDILNGATLDGTLPTLSYDVNVLSRAYEGARLQLLFDSGSLILRAANAADVPEPGSWLLLLTAMLLGVWRLRKPSSVIR